MQNNLSLFDVDSLVNLIKSISSSITYSLLTHWTLLISIETLSLKIIVKTLMAVNMVGMATQLNHLSFFLEIVHTNKAVYLTTFMLRFLDLLPRYFLLGPKVQQ